MSLFKTNPEIFANGQFKVDWADGKIVSELNAFGLTQIKEFPDMYKLIARPVRDITQSEVDEYTRLSNTIGFKDIIAATEYLHDRANGRGLNANDFLYLLRIGIYPGPQSDFDNGNVIRKEESNE